MQQTIATLFHLYLNDFINIYLFNIKDVLKLIKKKYCMFRVMLMLFIVLFCIYFYVDCVDDEKKKIY